MSSPETKPLKGRCSGKVLPFLAGFFTLMLLIFLLRTFDDFSRTIGFCSYCHSMKLMEKEYKESVHYESASGVRAQCGDCHVSQNLLPALWEHLWAATMVFDELIHDYEDPVITEKHRPEWAFKARRWFKKTGAKTCQKCHVLPAIRGSRPGIDDVHSPDNTEGKSCVECHVNLVHRKVPGEKVFNQERWDRMIDAQYGKKVEGAEKAGEQ